MLFEFTGPAVEAIHRLAKAQNISPEQVLHNCVTAMAMRSNNQVPVLVVQALQEPGKCCATAYAPYTEVTLEPAPEVPVVQPAAGGADQDSPATLAPNATATEGAAGGSVEEQATPAATGEQSPAG